MLLTKAFACSATWMFMSTGMKRYELTFFAMARQKLIRSMYYHNTKLSLKKKTLFSQFFSLTYRNLRAKKMSKIHINLFLSLIALYVTILSGNPISPDRSQCKNIATAVQYFSLVTIYWMSIEAVSMYLFVMKYKLPESNKLMLYACAVSYGKKL